LQRLVLRLAKVLTFEPIDRVIPRFFERGFGDRNVACVRFWLEPAEALGDVGRSRPSRLADLFTEVAIALYDFPIDQAEDLFFQPLR
jgi:hypothetical protein